MSEALKAPPESSPESAKAGLQEGTQEGFRELWDDAPCGYISARPTGEIVLANKTLLSWLGLGGEDLSGIRFQSLLTVPGALLYETHVAPLLGLRGFISEIALDLRGAEDVILPVLLSAIVKRDSSGAPSRFRIMILNAPRRREYERELVRARTQAEEAAEQLRALRELAERKVAEQDILLQSVARMAGGDLQTPVLVDAGSSLAKLADGLEQMRRDILDQMHKMQERNAEVQQLNRELRRQIEQRSRLLVESMESARSPARESGDDHAPVEIQPVLPTGRLLAERYRVEAILGQGGMGTVYEVERLLDGRRFAAKVLGVKPNYQTMARFAREAQLLARMHHPNLIDIVDVDVTDDQVAYIVMEVVRGKSLAEHGDRYGDRTFMLPVLAQIVEALAAVHGAGAVHRDLKPGNVLIAEGAHGSQTVKLADFGVSRLLDTAPETPNTNAQVEVEVASLAAHFGVSSGPREDLRSAPTMPGAAMLLAVTEAPPVSPGPQLTGAVLPLSPSPSPPPPPPPGDGVQRSPSPQGGSVRRRFREELTLAGTILGTPMYMAPELRVGAKLALPSSDIFSFGMMAYEVLTGRLPFDKPPLLWAELGIGEPRFEPLEHLCKGLDPELVRALEGCLAKDPLRRPTANELSVVLSGAVRR